MALYFNRYAFGYNVLGIGVGEIVRGDMKFLDKLKYRKYYFEGDETPEFKTDEDVFNYFKEVDEVHKHNMRAIDLRFFIYNVLLVLAFLIYLFACVLMVVL